MYIFIFFFLLYPTFLCNLLLKNVLCMYLFLIPLENFFFDSFDIKRFIKWNTDKDGSNAVLWILTRVCQWHKVQGPMLLMSQTTLDPSPTLLHRHTHTHTHKWLVKLCILVRTFIGISNPQPPYPTISHFQSVVNPKKHQI